MSDLKNEVEVDDLKLDELNFRQLRRVLEVPELSASIKGSVYLGDLKENKLFYEIYLKIKELTPLSKVFAIMKTVLEIDKKEIYHGGEENIEKTLSVYSYGIIAEYLIIREHLEEHLWNRFSDYNTYKSFYQRVLMYCVGRYLAWKYGYYVELISKDNREYLRVKRRDEGNIYFEVHTLYASNYINNLAAKRKFNCARTFSIFDKKVLRYECEFAKFLFNVGEVEMYLTDKIVKTKEEIVKIIEEKEKRKRSKKK